MNVNVNSKGVNTAIKAHILSDEEMREIGFTNYFEPYWYFCKMLGSCISFSVTIPKDGSDISIDVLDEDFGQPYDYQHMLERNPNHKFAISIKEKVENWMEYLQNNGVLEGHNFGDYI